MSDITVICTYSCNGFIVAIKFETNDRLISTTMYHKKNIQTQTNIANTWIRKCMYERIITSSYNSVYKQRSVCVFLHIIRQYIGRL